MRTNLISFVFLYALSQNVGAQQASYFDAAQAYSRLVLETNPAAVTRVDHYKVIGSPFLYGPRMVGNLFAKGETAFNITLSYDTYHQQVEFYSSANPTTPLIKDPGAIDSFSFASNVEVGILQGLKFYSGQTLGRKDDFNFYQLMYEGEKYSLYKKYYSTLGIVSTNILQSDLKQFELQFEYAYKPIGGELKRLKPVYFQVSKELKPMIDVREIVEPQVYSANPDLALLKIFAAIDKK